MSHYARPDAPAHRWSTWISQIAMRSGTLLPYFVAFCGTTTVTAAYLAIHDLIRNRPGVVGFTQIIVVLLVASRWGIGPALFASLLSLATFSYFFLAPYAPATWPLPFAVDRLEEFLLAVAFLVTSLLVGYISAQAKRRTDEAQANRQEIERLYVGLQQENDERKRTEMELNRQHEQLQQLVVALGEARHKAEAISRLKTVFLTTMSHELRTPLNAILGYAHILARDASLDERQKDGLNTIRQSGEHLLSLINDILDLSKIEAGRLEFNPAPVNLPLFLQGVADIIAVKAGQKGLGFSFDAPPDLPGAVLPDEKRLRQVLLNLLDNAVKFTARGQVTLRVRALSGPPETKAGTGNDAPVRLRFEVEDTGVGIAADQLETIFQPFEQVGAVAQRSGGTGLGLAISRQLARLMGCDIHVESRPGEGSRFCFELSAALSGDAEAVRLAPRVATGYQGARKKILIADDVPVNRRMLADFLGSLGFDTCEASNGREAVARTEAERPDLILMDATMPQMDGREATRRIRRMSGCATLPIFAVSSIADAGLEHAAAAGANAFIDKPIDYEVLLDLIGRHLGLTWIEAPPTATGTAGGACGTGGALLAPPADEMEILRQLALAGNMRDIKQRSDHLKRIDARYAPFADCLRDLARRYQSQAILALVNQYLKESEG